MLSKALVVTIFFFVLPIQIAAADSRAADCIQFGTPSSISSATVISLKVDVYAICSAIQLGKSNGQRPVYEMPQEESLFNLNSCSGPAVAPVIGSGFLGTVTCSLRVGSNSLPSPRTGATSTTIRAWFAWDFSEKSVSVPHAAIPAATNNGWGGSASGGSASGGSTPAPVTPSCKSTPSTPNLSIEWNSIGPKFTYSPQNSGEKATTLYWSYSLWNSSTKAWEGWSTWQPASVATGNYQATPIEGKNRIAFAVYAINSCGASDQAREASDNTGVPLAAVQEDTISKNEFFPSSISVGQTLQLYGVAKSSLGLVIEATSLSPAVCVTDSPTTIKLLGPGTCRLSIISKTVQNRIGNSGSELIFTVPKPKSPQVILTYPFASNYELSLGSIIVYLKTSSGVLAHVEASTDDICFMAGDTLVFKKIGTCNFTASQEGDELNLPAEPRDFSLEIVDSRKSLVCLKGKLIKKVVGINAKCPSGYKVRK